MKMAPKLLLLMLSLVALVAGTMSYVCLVNVGILSRRFSAVYTDSLLPLAAAQRMDGGIDEMRVALLSAFAMDGPGRETQLAQFNKRRTDFEVAFQEYAAGLTLNEEPETQDLLRRYGALADHMRREQGALKEMAADYPPAKTLLVIVDQLTREGKPVEAAHLYFEKVYPLLDRVNDNVATLHQLQLEESDYATRESRRVAATAKEQFVVAVIVILIVAVAVALAMSRAVTRPIHRLIAATREIARGNLSHVVMVRSKDEIGELASALNGMARELQKQHEEREARRLAEEASHAKSQFLANMSHEIRTPMTAIIGYSDMLLRPSQTQSDRLDAIQVIRRNARHLLELINDILDLSKIEAGKMTVERIDADLPRMVAEVLSTMRARAHEKALGLHVVFDGPIPRTVRTDPLRVRQVLVNLIGNAVKFTERGEVTLRVSCPSRSPEVSVIAFDVTDTGVGMSRDEIKKLFQPFTQADESTTRRFGGTGLGLSISKRLAEMLGGDISVRSEPGRGSTFSLTIEGGALAESQMLTGLTESQFAPNEPGQSAPQLTLNGRILLAEDGRDNQRLISAYLREAGAEVVVAENGRVAVEKARAESFALILMDMQMPEMDGYAATSELRRRGITVPVIALTAHAMSGDREKCLRCGCTDYLTKPIDAELLLNTVATYLLADARTAEPVDKSGAERLVSTMVDDGVVKRLLPDFIAELPSEVGKLLSLLRASELDELRRVAHQLKGAGKGYGFALITETAARAECAVAEGQALDLIAAEVESLVRLIRRVEGYNPALEPNRETNSAHH